MSIPVNTTDITAVAEATALKFANEIEAMENYIFKRPWEKNDLGVEVFRFYPRTSFMDFNMTTAHWDTLVANMKNAGYFAYRKWYHNGHYGTTEVDSYVFTKVPLTQSQMENMDLQSNWGTPCGPGRECFRGERL